MAAGVAQVIVGVALLTVIDTLAPTLVKFAVSAGVKATERVCPAPALRMVPLAGLYTKLPGTLAVAFNCAPPSAVPDVMLAGFAHVMVGVALVTVIGTLAVAGVKCG